MRIELDKLNPLELKIHDTMIEVTKEQPEITITRAAVACQVSSSKISKFVKKLGFSGYKEYLRFITGKELMKKKRISNEFDRISDFIETFDQQIVTNFIDTMKKYDKILLFGYGPSGICAEYFEYKLNVVWDKNIIALSQTDRLESLLTDRTILIIFSVTAQYSSFELLLKLAEEKKAKTLIVMEEYRSSIDIQSSEVLFLTKNHQNDSLMPHEKTRTIFFMFIEEVISQIRYGQTE